MRELVPQMTKLAKKDDGTATPDALEKQALQGDRKAFEALIRKYERRVLRTAYRFLGNREDARDAAQEVFLRMFRYRTRFHSQRPIQPWLYRMTLNVCKDLQKKRSAHPAVGLDSLPMPTDPSAVHAEIQALQQERVRILHACLPELNEKERAVLILRDIEGLTTRDVARVLRMPPGTVRSHLSRARLKLARYVAACLEDQR